MARKNAITTQLETRLREFEHRLKSLDHEIQQRQKLQLRVTTLEETLYSKQDLIEKLNSQIMQQSQQIKFFEQNFNMVQSLNMQLETENKHFSELRRKATYHGVTEESIGAATEAGGKQKQTQSDQDCYKF